MRLYKKVKLLPQNTIADVGCKGLLFVNSDPTLTLSVRIYSRDVDSTLKSVIISLPSVNSALSIEEPNYSIFPFHPEKWELISGIGSMTAYQLY